MRPALVATLGFALIAPALVAKRTLAFERLYSPTPVGKVEIKELPARVALSSNADGAYFARDNKLFMTLFEYIKENDISMTVPVEAEIEEAEMRFFVGEGLVDEQLDSTPGVSVTAMPNRQVVSVGLRGSYSEATFARGERELASWLSAHPEWRPAAPPYAVYWNGPYIPALFRRSEVHIPIAPAVP